MDFFFEIWRSEKSSSHFLKKKPPLLAPQIFRPSYSLVSIAIVTRWQAIFFFQFCVMKEKKIPTIFFIYAYWLSQITSRNHKNYLFECIRVVFLGLSLTLRQNRNSRFQRRFCPKDPKGDKSSINLIECINHVECKDDLNKFMPAGTNFLQLFKS